jgi:hypothetical protein
MHFNLCIYNIGKLSCDQLQSFFHSTFRLLCYFITLLLNIYTMGMQNLSMFFMSSLQTDRTPTCFVREFCIRHFSWFSEMASIVSWKAVEEVCQEITRSPDKTLYNDGVHLF